MKLKVITSVAIEKDGKFLILKRSSYDTLPGMWEFPGGKVKAGEKLIDSAKREVIEESGLTLNKLIYKGYSERFSEDRSVQTGYHTIIHHFYCKDFR
ncbi:MAG: NUDIX hydrolase, partial [Candidatus Aenigmatarchaeota archaeon]